jgi:hypothetical protein
MHEFKVKFCGDLEIIVQLNNYGRWFVHIRLKLGEVRVNLHRYTVGMVNERWLINHFEDDHFEEFAKFYGS